MKLEKNKNKTKTISSEIKNEKKNIQRRINIQ